jgi:tRNA A-37 threonylcarbamoyl transferase component Bud32
MEAVEASIGGVFHGRYQIVRKIAAGGMATVYEAVDLRTHRRRALKVMLPELARDPDLASRFALEARVTADVPSENIVETFDAGVDRETRSPFLVMELLRGEDLQTVLERRGHLPPEEAVALLRQVAGPLDRMHDAGIVHRDLKPNNIFLSSRDGGAPVLKILDFGIAKLVSQSSQSLQTTRNLGTPMYMSPEQIRGDAAIDHLADVYSLAQLAFALLAGQAFWAAQMHISGNVFGLMTKIAEGAREPASARAAALGVSLPPAFDAWFARATAVEPTGRFASAGESIRELSRALAAAPGVEGEGEVRPPASLHRPGPAILRRPVLVAGAVAIVFAAFGAWLAAVHGARAPAAAASEAPRGAPAAPAPPAPPTPLTSTDELLGEGETEPASTEASSAGPGASGPGGTPISASGAGPLPSPHPGRGRPPRRPRPALTDPSDLR